jgi:DNA-binding CsgD family transcriptional regulator
MEREVMRMADPLEERRMPIEMQAWRAEFDRLSAADRDGTLSVEGLERLALSAYMLDRNDDCADAWMRAHQEYLRHGEVQRAARCAFWQACGLLFRGELAPAFGWIARGRRVLESAPADCAEHGWLLVMTALPVMFQGDAASASLSFVEAGEIAERFGDADLVAFARLGLGQSLILRQQIAGGMSLLDEVMVAVMTGELSPIITGIAYCATIEMCQMVFDLRRAREWTVALTRWCVSQPDMVPYRGNCLVHRCEILQLQGEWHDALDAAQRACDLLAIPPAWDTLGSAYYQLGELQRLRGAFAQAEASYRQASRAGREPEPGMSLLRLAQDTGEIAAAGIRRVLDGTRDPIGRARLLPASVEIMLAVHDLGTAQAAADELQQIADDLNAPYLLALATHATGTVRLAEGNAPVALAELRRAYTVWRELDAPYQVARVRVLIGRAYQELGDAAGAELEFDAARVAFEELGAIPDLDRLNRRLSARSPRAIGGLSARESEVLTLLAAGKTNRAIANDLFISEKTVARHVSNILTKLDLSSRTEATAYAYRHGLIH